MKKNKKFLVFWVLCLVIATTFSGCSADPDAEWKNAEKVLRLPGEEYVVEYYIRYLEGNEFMLDEEISAIEKYAEVHPDEYKGMNDPIILKVDGREDPFIVYTDDEGNIKTTDGKTLGKIDR